MKAKFITTQLILLLLLLAAPSWAATYYVSKSGSGTTCSQASPCLTIATGLTKMSGGDTLIISAGTYAEQIASAQMPSGTANAKTVIRAATGETVILRPTGSIFDIVRFSGASKVHITLSGLIFEGNGATITSSLITINTSASFIRVENSTLRNASNGDCIGVVQAAPPVLPSTDLQFVNNLVYGCGFDDQNHGIYANGANLLIERNTVYNISGHGIHVYEASQPTQNAIIRYNYSHNNGSRGILMGSGNNNVMHHNISANNGADGIAVRFANGVTGPPTNNQVYNNTIFNNGTAATSTCMEINGAPGTLIKNNYCLSNLNNTITLIGTTTGTVGTCNDANGNLCNTTITNLVDVTGSTVGRNGAAGAARYSLREGAATLLNQGVTISTTQYTSAGKFVSTAPDIGALEAPVFAFGSIENTDANNVRFNFLLPSQGVRGGIGIQAANCSIGNFAITVAGSGAAENSCGTSGDRQAKVGVSGAVGPGDKVSAIYTRSATLANNLQDNICIGGDIAGACRNAEILTIPSIPTCPTSTPTCITNNVAVAVASTLEAINHRWFHIESSVASPAWRGPINASSSVMKGGYTGFVMGIDCTGGNCAPEGFQVYFKCNTAISAFCISNAGTYVPLTDDATTNGIAFGAYSASLVSDAETISSALITDPHGSFVAGKVLAKQATNPTVDLTQNSTTQLMALVTAASTAPAGEQFCFQPRTVDGTAITQTNTPCLTVVNPAMSTGF